MSWQKRYYQLLDSLQRQKTRDGREPRERRQRRQSRTSQGRAKPSQAARPVPASAPRRLPSARTPRPTRTRIRAPRLRTRGGR